MKKKYSKPEMKVYMVETQNILAASVGVEVQGLSDDIPDQPSGCPWRDS